MDYYTLNTRTVVNSVELAANLENKRHFPDGGLCIGSLNLPKIRLPVLIDLFNSKGLCFLYDSEGNKRKFNNFLEQLAWRISLCLPPEQCDSVVYNGGNPRDSFNSLNHWCPKI